MKYSENVSLLSELLINLELINPKKKIKNNGSRYS